MTLSAIHAATLFAEIAKRGASERWCPHDPHPKQATFLALQHKEALYGGAAAGGKSDALLMAALQYVHVPGYAAILFRRTLQDLKLDGALMDRSQEWLRGTAAKWNGADYRWTFPSGATVSFGYMQHDGDELRYKSAEYQFVGFDELTSFPEHQYRYLFSRLRRKTTIAAPLRMRAATNPGDIGHDWVGRRFGIPPEVDTSRVYEHEGRAFVPARIKDNPSVDEAEYRGQLSQLDEVTRAQLEFGRWIRDASKLVYRYDESRNAVDLLPLLPAGERWHYVLGIDYGNVDATAFVVLAWTEHDQSLYVAHAEKHDGLTPTHAAERVEALRVEWGEFDAMIGDVGGLGKGYAEQARVHHGLPIEPAEKRNKLGYIKLLNGDLEHARLRVVATACTALTGEWLTLQWSDPTQQIENQKQANHCADAALYGARHCWHTRATPRKVIPKPGTTEAYAAEEQRMRARLEREARQEAREARGRYY